MEKNVINNLFFERYPEIYFHLTYSEHERSPGLSSGEEEIAKLDLREIEIVYLCGIDQGLAYAPLKNWLKQERQRRLIFLEDDLGELAALRHTQVTEEILQDPQVEIRFVQNWESEIESLAQTYPTQIAIEALPSYKKKYRNKFSKIRLRLLRATSVYQAIFSEGLFAHKLLANLAENMSRLPDAFYANKMEGRYREVPAIICGAGPSLKSSIETLKKLENRALIFAGGSAIAALSNAGVVPHFLMALDPNPEELERLKQAVAFEVPLLFGSRVNPAIFSTINGPIGYIKSDTGGAFEAWMEERLSITGAAIGPDLGREALSVTTLAIAFAFALGCNPIILDGVDLAFTDKKRYAEGVVLENLLGEKLKKGKRASERLLRRKDRGGKPVFTLVKWVMESKCISDFAKGHAERVFLNATEGGIGFSEIPFFPLHEIAQKYCRTTFDLRGRIHKDIQELSLSNIAKERISALYEQLALSLRRSLILCEEILEELKQPTARKIVLELDLEQEIAYKPLLELAFVTLDRQASRHATNENEREQLKWRHAKEIIQSQLRTLNRFGACCAASEC